MQVAGISAHAASFWATGMLTSAADAISIGSEGVEGKVLENLDYGEEKFIKILVRGSEFLVAVNEFPTATDVKVVFDLTFLSVREMRRDIQII